MNILNARGKAYALRLVSAGRVDRTSSWSFSSEDARRELGSPPSWARFERIHMGFDTQASLMTMGRFKYPFAKHGRVYRRGIIAVKSRAAANGDATIARAADAVLRKIDAADNSNNCIPYEVFSTG